MKWKSGQNFHDQSYEIHGNIVEFCASHPYSLVALVPLLQVQPGVQALRLDDTEPEQRTSGVSGNGNDGSLIRTEPRSF